MCRLHRFYNCAKVTSAYRATIPNAHVEAIALCSNSFPTPTANYSPALIQRQIIIGSDPINFSAFSPCQCQCQPYTHLPIPSSLRIIQWLQIKSHLCVDSAIVAHNLQSPNLLCLPVIGHLSVLQPLNCHLTRSNFQSANLFLRRKQTNRIVL